MNKKVLLSEAGMRNLDKSLEKSGGKTRRSLVLVVLSAILCVLLLCSCGDKATSIKKDTFYKKLSEDCGNPPDVLLSISRSNHFGLSEDSQNYDNLRLAGDEGLKVKNPSFVDMADALGVLQDSSGKTVYYGGYVLSDDEEQANSMRKVYTETLIDKGWELAKEGDVYGDIYSKDGHVVAVDKVIGPVYWDIPQDSPDTLYGMYVWFY